MSAKKVMIGMMVGAAAGAAMGILFAPGKGSTIRRKFRRKSFDYTEELDEKFNELIDSITEQFQDVVDEVNSMAETEKRKSEKAKLRPAKM